MLEFFLKNLVRLIAEMPLSANLFRVGSSIQRHAGSRGCAPPTKSFVDKKKIKKKNFDKKKIHRKFFFL